MDRERAASISVHKGLKIQAALCVERPPMLVQEPDFKRQWRVFKEAWDRRTGNGLTIQDEIVFMRFHFQFLQDPKEKGFLDSGDSAEAQIGGSGGSSGKGKSKAEPDAVASIDAPQEQGLDAMLSSEGLGQLAFPDIGRKTVRRRKAQKQAEEAVDDSDVRSVRRLGDRSLFLLVKYGGRKWTFPKADRAHGMPMREMLLRLWERQLCKKFEPYIVGACPFAHRKRLGSLHAGIEGRKIFYYRARMLPGAQVLLPGDSPVSEWAWCSRDELRSYLDEGEWRTVRDGLPIDKFA